MSARKRSLHTVDEVGLPVTFKATSTSRPTKKFRDEITPQKFEVAETRGGREKTTRAQPDRKTCATTPGDRRKSQPGLWGANDEPVYVSLGPNLLPAVVAKTLNLTSSLGITDFVRGIISSRAKESLTEMLASKLRYRTIHLKNSARPELQNADARTPRSTTKPHTGLGRKQLRKKGLSSLTSRESGDLSFRDMIPFHELWKKYASRVVSSCTQNMQALQQRVLAADLQGCFLTVCQASATSMVGKTGILVQETAKTFHVITPEGNCKTIPKRGCIFRFMFGSHVMRLDGRVVEGRRGGRTLSTTIRTTYL